jgi:hypothetical protein
MAKRGRGKRKERLMAATSGGICRKPAFPGPLRASHSEDGDPLRAAATLERHNRERLAAAAAREPLDYRMAHKALSGDRDAVVERFGLSLPDVKGDIGNPHRTYDTLATLRRNGSIGDPELEAGRAFEEDFIRARLDTLHASDPARIPGAGAAELTDVMVAGRRRVNRAMTALGGTATAAGSAAWCVLGGGQTLKEWAAASQFGQGRRSLDEKVAKGIFVAALGLLAVHYGKRRQA